MKGEIGKEKDDSVTTVQRVLRVNMRKDSVEFIEDEVVVESRINLYLNDKQYAVFWVSPSEIKEMMIGHLLAEGIIKNISEIETLKVKEGRVNVHLTKNIDLPSKPRIILTECSSREPKIPPHLWMKIKATGDASPLKFNYQIILRTVKVLNSRADVYKRTGGTHAATLLNENGRVLAFSEDIGRHNAVDKVIGKGALKKVDFERTLLATTGRLTSDMVIKAANVGVPAVVSISAPTDKGVKAARMTGLTLVGFVRGRRLNIYTHQDRFEKK